MFLMQNNRLNTHIGLVDINQFITNLFRHWPRIIGSHDIGHFKSTKKVYTFVKLLTLYCTVVKLLKSILFYILIFSQYQI